jgi:methionyl-tRNA formyltransferase
MAEPEQILFFGTPQFAYQILEQIEDNPEIDIAGVVTAPDKPVGRKQILTPSPVKTFAVQHQIPVYTPDRVNSEQFLTTLSELVFDAIVVAAYGSILSPRFLNTADPRPVINVHPSLLPKYRGPAPIQAALAAGDETTGVTLIEMDEHMDHGPILSQEEIPIDPDETIDDLEPRLADLSATLLSRDLPTHVDYGTDSIYSTPQAHEEATFTSFVTKEDGRIDWSQTAEDIYNQYRALQRWPGVFTYMNDQKVALDDLALGDANSSLSPGDVQPSQDVLRVGTDTGEILVGSLKPAGKQFMDAATFVNGYNVKQFS